MPNWLHYILIAISSFLGFIIGWKIIANMEIKKMNNLLDDIYKKNMISKSIDIATQAKTMVL